MWSVFCAALLVGTLARSHDLEHSANCDADCDAGSLLQRGKVTDKSESPNTLNLELAGAADSNKRSSRNLLVFFDGTGCSLEKLCDFREGYCESHIAKMYRQTKSVDNSQLAYYMTGVGTDDTGAPLDSATGESSNTRAKEVYSWIAGVYQPGDKIFAFGHSRGCISARILQGMIHRVGIAKKGYDKEAIEASYRDSNTEKFNAANKSYPGSNTVHFLGLFESVLRTLSDALPKEMWHMAISPAVQTFAHAMALGEWRKRYEVSELIVPETTHATQVWFAGQHADLGGGRESDGINNISKAWMVDQAIASGMRMPSGWEASLNLNAQGDLRADRPVHGIDGVGWAFRNPYYCRQEAGFGDAPIKVHQSVKDRMGTPGKLDGLVPGWVPPQMCCSDYEFLNNVEWVSNDAYDKAVQSPVGSFPQWAKVVLGRLENAKTRRSQPKFYARVQEWHSSKPLTPLTDRKWGDRTYDAEKDKYPQKEGVPTEFYCPSTPTLVGSDRGSCDFTGTLYPMLPADAASVDEFLIEVWEENLHDDLVGRFVLKYDDPSVTEMMPRDIDDPDGASNAVFWAKLDLYTDDDKVKEHLNPSDPSPVSTTAHAQCIHFFDLLLKKSESEMCKPVINSCSAFIDDLTANS